MVRVIRIGDALSGQACHFSREFPAGRDGSVFRKRSAADGGFTRPGKRPVPGGPAAASSGP